ncbi:MAG: XdhC/CoxI family protein [Clostridium sp.]|nr:XdhC/CoxI family protein [Clostridium sp.]
MKRDFYTKLYNELKRSKEVYLITIVSGEHQGKKLSGQKLLKADNNILIEDDNYKELWNEILNNITLNKGTYNSTYDNKEIFIEYLASKANLVICGGGHIALPLCNIGKLLDFNVTVIDDRKEFANYDRFNLADEVICGNFEEVLKERCFGKNSYFVIVTRGHRDDRICLESVIDKGYAYVGMIGSKAKVATVVTALLEAGYTQELIDKVHTPIGLNIGGKTPAEIAVSIAAEIIQEKNINNKTEISEEILRDLIEDKQSKVLATIVEKLGSSPRGVGTKMLIKEDRSFKGTVGGGSVENAVYLKSLELIKNRSSDVESYNLSNSDASTLGMVCGGKVKVVFEYI